MKSIVLLIAVLLIWKANTAAISGGDLKDHGKKIAIELISILNMLIINFLCFKRTNSCRPDNLRRTIRD